jgi:hypothetical protein
LAACDLAQIVPLGRGRTIPTKGKLFVLLTLTEPQVFEKPAENTNLLISKFQVRALVRQRGFLALTTLRIFRDISPGEII